MFGGHGTGSIDGVEYPMQIDRIAQLHSTSLEWSLLGTLNQARVNKIFEQFKSFKFMLNFTEFKDDTLSSNRNKMYKLRLYTFAFKAINVNFL